MNADQLNAVANFLTSQGIEVTKELVFSVCIKTLVESGVPVADAVDSVLGSGRFDEIKQAVIDGLYA